MLLDWSAHKPFDFKSALRPVHISGDIVLRMFVVSLVEKRKYCWLVLLVTLMHTHSNLSP